MWVFLKITVIIFNIYLLLLLVDNLSFEARIKDLTNVKDQSSKLNPKVIETWINETLLDAEHLDIPGIVLKPEHKNPVSRYQIDRLYLTVRINYNNLLTDLFRMLVLPMIKLIGFIEVSLCIALASMKCFSAACTIQIKNTCFCLQFGRSLLFYWSIAASPTIKC
jgi:hypothetical protein